MVTVKNYRPESLAIARIDSAQLFKYISTLTKPYGCRMTLPNWARLAR